MVSLRLIKLTQVYQAVSLAIAMGLTAALVPELWLSVLAGGALIAANFAFLRALVHKTLADGPNKALYAAGLGFKFVVAMGLLALMLLVFKLDGLGVMLGMCTLFGGMALALPHVLFTSERPTARPTDRPTARPQAA